VRKFEENLLKSLAIFSALAADSVKSPTGLGLINLPSSLMTSSNFCVSAK